MNRTILILLALCVVQTQADPVDVVRSAVERHRAVSLDGWSFDRVVRRGGIITREKCVGLDVHQAACQLVATDGRAPTEQELAKYARRHPGQVEENLPNADPATWIDMNTVSVDERSPGTIQVSYRGAVDEGGDYEKLGAMRGVAVVDVDGPMVASLRTATTRSFKPTTGVKVKSLVSSAAFQRVGDSVFLKGVEIRGEGKAFGLSEIDVHTVVEFENFSKPE